MNIVHIVRGDYTPQAINGVYNVIDNLSEALTKVNRGGAGGDASKRRKTPKGKRDRLQRQRIAPQ